MIFWNTKKALTLTILSEKQKMSSACLGGFKLFNKLYLEFALERGSYLSQGFGGEVLFAVFHSGDIALARSYLSGQLRLGNPFPFAQLQNLVSNFQLLAVFIIVFFDFRISQLFGKILLEIYSFVLFFIHISFYYLKLVLNISLLFQFQLWGFWVFSLKRRAVRLYFY